MKEKKDVERKAFSTVDFNVCQSRQMGVGMSIFYDLIRFEYKKALVKRGSILALILGTLIAAVSVFGTIISNEYNSDGELQRSGYEGMLLDREYQIQLSGRAINDELILEAVGAYAKVPLLNTSGRYSDSKEYEDYARKYSRIYAICRMVYNASSIRFDIEDFQALSKETAENFYDIRRKRMEQRIMYTGMSNKAKDNVMDLDRQLDTPFIFEYADGYYRFVTIMYTTAMIGTAVITIIFASVFSGEYVSGADELILSSRHGKRILIHAKLFVVFSFTVIYTVFLTLLTYIECMLVFGSEGKNAAIQLFDMSQPYAMTVGQSVLIYFFSILTACLLSLAVTVLLSSLFKTPFWVIVLCGLLLIVPMFLNVSEDNVLLYHLYCLLPSNMMAYECSINFIQYEVFGQIIKPYIFQPLFAAVVTLILIPFAYRSFQRHQVV